MTLNRLLCLLLLLFLGLAGTAEAEDICFDNSTVARITADLERGRNAAEQVELLKQANTELEQQVRLLKEVVSLQKEQLKAGAEAIRQYQDIITYQGKVYEQAVKDARPGFIKQLIDAVSFIGLGVLAGALLL